MIGQGPLPPELAASGEQRLSAPSIRAWHFALALHQAGHPVRLVSVHSGSAEIHSAPKTLATDFILQPVSEATVTGQPFLAELVKSWQASAVVAASVWPSYLAALFAPPDLPFWADLFGSPLAEAQAKAVLIRDDQVIEPFARFEAMVLKKADHVSTVSSYQQYATVGALATYGRLNRHTDGIELASVIPATLDPQILAPAPQTFLRSKIVPHEAFVVLWSGGYNTWTDVDCLFAGLEGAMATCPSLHFVSTGGGLPPHDSQTYPHFQRLVESSAYRERFHLLGWVAYEGLHNYYLESDLGIVLDRWSYEGVLGSRTRLLDWLLYGLPAAVTVTAELTEELARAGLAFSFPHGDGAALTARLVRLASRPAELTQARQQASQYVINRFAYRQACQPLLAWTANPVKAPDAGESLPVPGGAADPALERRLADYQAQLEAKNAQIAGLEGWAAQMERQLKGRSRGWRAIFRRFKK